MEAFKASMEKINTVAMELKEIRGEWIKREGYFRQYVGTVDNGIRYFKDPVTAKASTPAQTEEWRKSIKSSMAIIRDDAKVEKQLETAYDKRLEILKGLYQEAAAAAPAGTCDQVSRDVCVPIGDYFRSEYMRLKDEAGTLVGNLPGDDVPQSLSDIKV